MPTKTTNSKLVQVRIDKNLADEVKSILKEIGLTDSDAIRIFFRKIVRTRSIPFDLTVPYYTKSQRKEIEQTLINIENGEEELSSLKPEEDVENFLSKI